jgi:rhodanese-related sulfurtransferase
MRSSCAASLLAHEGFKEVINAASGFEEWAKAGLPIEK